MRQSFMTEDLEDLLEKYNELFHIVGQIPEDQDLPIEVVLSMMIVEMAEDAFDHGYIEAEDFEELVGYPPQETRYFYVLDGGKCKS